MKKLLAIAGGVVFLGVLGSAVAGTLFTGPVIFVRPTVVNFGPVAPGESATNTFVVENMGNGRLTGSATVGISYACSPCNDNLPPNDPYRIPD